MAFHTTRNINEQPSSGFTRLLMFLSNPHPSVQDIGERARAQLLGIVTLILTVVYFGALFSRQETSNDFIALLFITILAYTLSRTSYYWIGIYLFCFSFTAFAYFTLLLGTASSFISAITTSFHVSLIVASLLLASRSLVVLVIFVSIASFTAPLYSKVPIAIDSDFYKDAGVAVSIGIVLIGATLFRSFIERKRIEQLNQANRDLENLTANLEQRVNERTAELENTAR